MREKYERLTNSSPDANDFEDKLKEFMGNSTELSIEYTSKIRESLARSIVQTKLDEKTKELKDLNAKYKELESTVKRFKVKKKKRERYIKKQKRKKNK